MGTRWSMDDRTSLCRYVKSCRLYFPGAVIPDVQIDVMTNPREIDIHRQLATHIDKGFDKTLMTPRGENIDIQVTRDDNVKAYRSFTWPFAINLQKVRRRLSLLMSK